jgi:tetratricopeptide (TPR) repeat protein
MTSPSIFISYSQDSDEHKSKVLQFADRLRNDGIDANIDQYQTNPPEGWQLWMEKQIRDSQFVILVCTEIYHKRVMKEDEGRGKGVMWESTIIDSYLYDSGVVNEKFIPIVFGHENTKHIPRPLKSTTFYDVSSEGGYENLYRYLTDQPYTTKLTLGKLKSLPPRSVGARHVAPLPINKISLAKLPSTDPNLFGREDRLKQLEEAWQNPKINIVTLVAWGGVGKTALVNKWLSGLGESYGGAERVYGWSFYSQGAAEGRQVSADQFIAAALAWFGDPDPNAGSPWDKGERLAELIKMQRTLLILDGLEPLQSPPPVETGKIKDPALTSLLRELARQNPGLVVISTRLSVDDLKDFIGNTAVVRDLESLSDEAGSKYLEHLGVIGTEDERKTAAHDFGGHALALTLLGRYLADIYDGDIRRRKEIPHLTDEEEKGGHAKRIMKAYEKWFEGKPELDLLKLMGLFDRPAVKDAMDALLAKPVIDGLTDQIQGLPQEKYKLVLKHLRKARLLAEPDPHAPDALDCHPLLREHFGEQLKQNNPAAWHEANNRLYEYYKASAKEYPDTLQEMAPLFAAVMHGCQAGRHEEAFYEVYWKRILRGKEHFSWRKLGSFGSDLATISPFFDGTSWRKPVDGLRGDYKGFILNQAGFCLRALGRLIEAAQPMQTALQVSSRQKNWLEAAKHANNMSELYLTIGDVQQALAYAEQSVGLADKSGDGFMRMQNRTKVGDSQHQAGDLANAQAAFNEAEEIQKKRQPEFSLLYSLPGFLYCDLLLSQGKVAEVERRASQTLEWALQQQVDILSAALDNLSLGRAKFVGARYIVPQPNDAIVYFNRAVDGLRQAGSQEFIARGLLARAEYCRVIGDLVKAQRDLDEVFSIATRGGMGLHLADCHLGYARLALARGTDERRGEAMLRPYRDDARAHLSTAKEMIEKMGYHRRDNEVEELEEQLK